MTSVVVIPLGKTYVLLDWVQAPWSIVNTYPRRITWLNKQKVNYLRHLSSLYNYYLDLIQKYFLMDQFLCQFICKISEFIPSPPVVLNWLTPNGPSINPGIVQIPAYVDDNPNFSYY